MDCCIFVHYGLANRLLAPDHDYVNKLSCLFSEVIVVTNEREFELHDLPNSVKLKFVKNGGYDFGMFFKVFIELNLSSLDRLALVNDSNFLLGDLGEIMEKGKLLRSDFWGIIDSLEKPWFSTHIDNYHLQSHFLVWEKGSFPILSSFIDEINIKEFLEESSPKKLRRKVINSWEIGLSQYFMSKKYFPEALFQTKILAAKLGKKPTLNLTMTDPEFLLSQGYPLFKKKYIARNNFLKRLLYPKKRWEYLLKTHSPKSVFIQDWIDQLKRPKN